jgi:branched-chain amino acid transport system ATP-binding protein
MMANASLEISGLSKRFGGVPAITDFSLVVMPGERRLILGPNGAGKTTLFNLISGDVRNGAGVIRIGGVEVSGMSTAQRARLGLGRTYQILTLFAHDTLLHNAALAVLGGRSSRWNPLARFEASTELRQSACECLRSVGLDKLAHQPLVNCSYGEKRRLEIALALAQRPKLLLLDEPLAGLSQAERNQISTLLQDIPSDVATVMIEHDMKAALAFADRVSVLHHGRLMFDGTREDVVADPKTREVYLGR